LIFLKQHIRLIVLDYHRSIRKDKKKQTQKLAREN